jgi:hypothetical protein
MHHCNLIFTAMFWCKTFSNRFNFNQFIYQTDINQSLPHIIMFLQIKQSFQKIYITIPVHVILKDL